jgi:hypothetical protein
MICDMTIFKLDGKINLTLKIYKKKKAPCMRNQRRYLVGIARIGGKTGLHFYEELFFYETNIETFTLCSKKCKKYLNNHNQEMFELNLNQKCFLEL